MNISEDRIIEGLEKAAIAENMVTKINQDMKDGFYNLKESIRQDLQRVLAGEVKLVIKQSMEDHHDRVVRPHLQSLGATITAQNDRIIILEGDKKGLKMVIGFATVLATGAGALLSNCWNKIFN